MDELNLLDLGDVEDWENLPETRKTWTMVLLTVIREGGTFVCLRLMNGNYSLWFYVNDGWLELVPPPVDMGPSLREAIRAWGENGPTDRLPSELPWECRFRLRLGLGFKDVLAKAKPIEEGIELILGLTDVTIPSLEAERVLRQLIERRGAGRNGQAGIDG